MRGGELLRPMERLQKVLAAAGLGSRRGCERLIVAGRVTVNGAVASLGMSVAASDVVLVDGKQVVLEELVYLMLHKPVGVLTTVRDPGGRPTVMSLVDVPQRVFPVGRLDKETSGLLLFTNDGDLAQGLLHPSKGVRKRYEATVRGDVVASALARLERGVMLDDGPTAPCRARLLGGGRVLVEIKEGRKRQVRRMLEAVGHPVVTLHRVGFGPLVLGDLKVGQWRDLTEAELSMLRGQLKGSR